MESNRNDIKIGQKVRIKNGAQQGEIGKLKGFNYHRTKKGAVGLGGTLCLIEVEGSRYFSYFGLLLLHLWSILSKQKR